MKPRPIHRFARPAGPNFNRSRELETVIRERITSRLGQRIRNLGVAVDRGVIHIAGQCSTYYTKQLAQHAVLGVVEDEVVDNRIEVRVSMPAATA